MLIKFHRFPLTQLVDLDTRIDSVLGDLLSDVPVLRHSSFPAIDLAENQNESVVRAEVPGVKKEDLKISFQERSLVITGDRKSSVEEDKGSWLRKETTQGTFSRTVMIPHEVAVDAITAELADGVLRVVLPKAADARPRKIQVR